MTRDDSDTCMVHELWGLGVEEQPTHESGRKNQGIGVTAVEGIDNCHDVEDTIVHPVRAVDLEAQTCKFLLRPESAA